MHANGRLCVPVSSQGADAVPFVMQEQGFLRDFGLYTNNLGGAASLPHSNLTSWTWYASM